MVINGTDPFDAAKPDARLIKLLLRARRFNATLAQGECVPFAALAEREGVSRSYFTRLVRLSYLAPDITEAILDGRQPPDLTAEKLLDTHVCRLPGTTSGPCSALLEPDPNSKTTHAKARKLLICSDRRGIAADRINLTAVLEYGPAETLPPVGAQWKARCVSADPVVKRASHTCGESPGS